MIRSRSTDRWPARHLLEPLEPRRVLSSAYYAWVEVSSLPGVVAEYGPPDGIAGSSENGRYLWSETAANKDNPHDPDEPYLVVDGHVRYVRDIPELDNAVVAGIDSHGVLLGAIHSGDNAGAIFTLDLTTTAAPTFLDPDHLDAPQNFDLSSMQPEAITDGGALVLTSPTASGRRLWVLVGNRVEQLWQGEPGSLWNADGLYVDSNTQNVIIGYRLDRYGRGRPMMWSPAEGMTDLAAVGFTELGSINDDGSVLVRGAGGNVLLRDGVVHPIEFSSNDGVNGLNMAGRPRGRDASGTLILRVPVGDPKYAESEEYFVRAEGLANIRLDYSYAVLEMRIMESGVVFFGEWTRPGWYAPTDGLSFYRSAAGAPAALWRHDGQWEVYSRFRDGASLRYVSQHAAGAGAWEPEWRKINLNGRAEAWEWEWMENPATGSGLLLIEGENGWTSLGTNEPEDGFAQQRVFHSIGQLGDHLTGFFGHSRRPVVAGYDPAGNLRMLYVLGRGFGETRVVSLTDDHLAVRGLDTPAFASGLDSFITPWGAMNIVGLDGAGDLHAVWWSPGLKSALWTTSNLSDITGAPRLVGNVTASATKWNGMQVFGTDERGHLIAVWWSPSSGGWRWDDLTLETEGAPVVAGSITGAATRWGAIEVVGRTSDNEVVTYWWAPTSGGWRFESITAQQSGETARIVGPISMAVGRDGSHHISGVSEDGDVIHLYWLPDGTDLWRGENLTELALS